MTGEQKTKRIYEVASIKIEKTSKYMRMEKERERKNTTKEENAIENKGGGE